MQRSLCVSLWLVLLALLLGETLAIAAWLQYRVADLQVLGAFESVGDMRPTLDTAPLEIAGPATAIVWPVPASCARGQMLWTKLSPGAQLPLIVNPALIFFRCQVVRNGAILDAIVAEQVKRLYATPSPLPIEVLVVIQDTTARHCPVTDLSAQCQSMRTTASTLAGRAVSKAQMQAMLDAIAQLLAEASALKTTQGW